MDIQAAMRSLQDVTREQERERCAAIARKYVERTNADIAHAILREIEQNKEAAQSAE